MVRGSAVECSGNNLVLSAIRGQRSGESGRGSVWNWPLIGNVLPATHLRESVKAV